MKNQIIFVMAMVMCVTGCVENTNPKEVIFQDDEFTNASHSIPNNSEERKCLNEYFLAAPMDSEDPEIDSSIRKKACSNSETDEVVIPSILSLLDNYASLDHPFVESMQPSSDGSLYLLTIAEAQIAAMSIDSNIGYRYYTFTPGQNTLHRIRIPFHSHYKESYAFPSPDGKRLLVINVPYYQEWQNKAFETDFEIPEQKMIVIDLVTNTPVFIEVVDDTMTIAHPILCGGLGCENLIDVAWVDSTTFIVSLYDKEKIKNILHNNDRVAELNYEQKLRELVQVANNTCLLNRQRFSLSL